MVSLFNKDLRGFLQMAPEYMKPVHYDAHKLEKPAGGATHDPLRDAASPNSRLARRATRQARVTSIGG